MQHSGKSWKWLLWLMLFLSPNFIVRSQHYVKYTVSSGLPANIVYQIFQDSKKRIWFATEAGVSRYNGLKMSVYTKQDGLGSNEIYKIEETSDGKVWFLGANGTASYFENNAFHQIPYQFNTYLTNIYEWEEKVYISSFGDGYLVYDLKSKKVSKFNDPFNRVSLFWEKDNALFVFDSRGIYKLGQKGPQKVHSFPNDFHLIRGVQHGKDLIFTSKGRFFRFNGKELIGLTGGAPFSSNQINAHGILGNNHFLSTYKGIYFVDYDSSRVQIVRRVMDDIVSSIIQDHEGAYWISTLGNGVYYRNNLEFVPIEGSRGFKASAFSSHFKQDLMVGGNHFLFGNIGHEKLKVEKLPSMKRRLIERPVSFLKKEQETYWMGYRTYLIRKKDSIYDFISLTCRDILIDKNDVFVVSHAGTLKLTKQYINDSLINQWKASPTDKTVLPISSYCVELIDGKYYVGTEKGLYTSLDGLEFNRTSEKELQDIVIQDVQTLNEHVVFSTLGRGILIKRENDLIKIDENAGLPDNYCRKMVSIENRLYILTTNEICEITFNSDWSYSIKFLDHHFTSLQEQITDLQFRNDSLYVASESGIFKFHVKNFNVHRNFEIPLKLGSTSVNGLPSSLKDLSYKENDISLNFEAIYFGLDASLELQHRFLNEPNSPWISSKDLSLSFKSLSPGDYEIEVRAVAGTNHSSTSVYKFTIAPPYWQTWWFKLSLLGLVALLIYMFFRIRVLTYNRDVVREILMLLATRLKRQYYVEIKDTKDGGMRKLNIAEILFIEAAHNYAIYHLNDGSRVTVRKTLKTAVKEINLKKKFFSRCHKSFAVNISKITSYRSDSLKVGEYTVMVGKQYLAELKNDLGK